VIDNSRVAVAERLGLVWWLGLIERGGAAHGIFSLGDPMNRLLLVVVGGVVVVLVGWLWLAAHDRDVRQQALLAQRDSVIGARDRMIAVSEQARQAAELVSGRARIAVAQANAATAERGRALASTSARLDSALRSGFHANPSDTVILALRPSATVLLDSLEQSWAGRLAGADSTAARNALETRRALDDLAACNDAARRIEGQVVAWKAEAARWKQVGQPGLVQRILTGLPWAGVGTGVGVVVAVALHG
jgi:hypothetical protein